MKLALLISLLLSATFYSVAQDSSFHLKDYKFRTPGFRALSLGINLGGSVNSNKNGPFNDKHRSFYVLPSAVNYYRIVSTDKRLHTSTFNLSSAVSANYNQVNKKDMTAGNIQYEFSWQRNDRLYKSNNWFFEIGNSLTNRGNASKNKDTVFKSKQRTFGLVNTASIGFGKGRIEQVQDAQMALFILNDLQQQGLLNTPVTPEQAEQFAQLITNINNRRIFDNRRRRIYELTQLDAFLKTSGLVETTDIRHFATINDNWALAFNPFRLSGASWFVRLQPSVSVSTENSSLENSSSYKVNHKQNTIGLSPVIGYEKFVPLNIHWQHGMGINASYQIARGVVKDKQTAGSSSSENEFKINERGAVVRGFYQIGYYPNNRTLINANLQVEALNIRDDIGIINKSDFIRPSLTLSANYFISYRTQFFANLYSEYLYTTNKSENIEKRKATFFGANFSVGLTHAIL